MTDKEMEYIHNICVGTGIDVQLIAVSFGYKELKDVPSERFETVTRRIKMMKGVYGKHTSE